MGQCTWEPDARTNPLTEDKATTIAEYGVVFPHLLPRQLPEQERLGCRSITGRGQSTHPAGASPGHSLQCLAF